MENKLRKINKREVDKGTRITEHKLQAKLYERFLLSMHNCLHLKMIRVMAVEERTACTLSYVHLSHFGGHGGQYGLARMVGSLYPTHCSVGESGERGKSGLE